MLSNFLFKNKKLAMNVMKLIHASICTPNLAGNFYFQLAKSKNRNLIYVFFDFLEFLGYRSASLTGSIRKIRNRGFEESFDESIVSSLEWRFYLKSHLVKIANLPWAKLGKNISSFYKDTWDVFKKDAAALIYEENLDNDELVTAYHAFQSSAHYGYYPAKIELARCLAFGIGVEKNLPQAIKQYQDFINFPINSFFFIRVIDNLEMLAANFQAFQPILLRAYIKANQHETFNSFYQPTTHYKYAKKYWKERLTAIKTKPIITEEERHEFLNWCRAYEQFLAQYQKTDEYLKAFDFVLEIMEAWKDEFSLYSHHKSLLFFDRAQFHEHNKNFDLAFSGYQKAAEFGYTIAYLKLAEAYLNSWQNMQQEASDFMSAINCYTKFIQLATSQSNINKDDNLYEILVMAEQTMSKSLQNMGAEEVRFLRLQYIKAITEIGFAKDAIRAMRALPGASYLSKPTQPISNIGRAVVRYASIACGRLVKGNYLPVSDFMQALSVLFDYAQSNDTLSRDYKTSKIVIYHLIIGYKF
jgi:hypothetical protein